MSIIILSPRLSTAPNLVSTIIINFLLIESNSSRVSAQQMSIKFKIGDKVILKKDRTKAIITLIIGVRKAKILDGFLKMLDAHLKFLKIHLKILLL